MHTHTHTHQPYGSTLPSNVRIDSTVVRTYSYSVFKDQLNKHTYQSVMNFAFPFRDWYESRARVCSIFLKCYFLKTFRRQEENW